MKSHAQPGFPPMPSILTIAAARRPEKALASEVAENSSAILVSKVRGLRKFEFLAAFAPQLELPFWIERGEVEYYPREQSACVLRNVIRRAP